MKRSARIIALVLFAALALPVLAWNLDAKNINALIFEREGRILFTLFNAGPGSPEFLCGTGTGAQWFTIAACTDELCAAHVNRMASLLLAAKVSGKRVHVQRTVCAVTEVALKP